MKQTVSSILFVLLLSLIPVFGLALVEDGSGPMSGIPLIIDRCESKSNQSAQLDCYKAQLNFLSSQGSVQSEELYNQSMSSLEPDKRCYRDICAGDEVFYTQGSETFKAEVSDVDEINRFSIKVFEDNGSLKELAYDVEYTLLSLAKGCFIGFCVGDSVIQLRVVDGKQKNYRVVIAGFQPLLGEFVVEYLPDSMFGVKYGGNWDYDDLAFGNGCVKHVCVGEEYLNVSRDNVRVRILGIRHDNKIVMEYLEGDWTLNTPWGFWSPEDFVPLQISAD